MKLPSSLMGPPGRGKAAPKPKASARQVDSSRRRREDESFGQVLTVAQGAGATTQPPKERTSQLSSPGTTAVGLSPRHAGTAPARKPAQDREEVRLSPLREVPPLPPTPERTTAAAELGNTSGTGPAAEPAPVRAPPSAELLEMAQADASLHLAVHASHVRVALTTEAAGTLELDLRLRDGRAEVHFDGPATPLVAHRGDELRAALSKEGLELGGFSLAHRDEQPSQRRPDDESHSVRPPTPQPVNSPSERRHEGRIDIEA